MKKFIIFSFLLHSIILAMLLFSTKPESQENNATPEQSEGEYEITPIEKPEENPESGADETKNYYWGIGISTYQFYDPKYNSWVIKINYVYEGYSAFEAGLLANDIIVQINGKEIDSQNDIKSDGPGRLILTIERQGVIIHKSLNRVKVYY